MQKFFSDAAAFVAQKKKQRLWIAVVLVLACAVVLTTVCALVRPASALNTPTTYCGMEEHTHTDACYTWELICGQEESAGHTHTEACYAMQPVLICGQEESEEHTHTDACYETQRVLTCGQAESAGHTHTDACYSEVLTCGKEEHTHTDACYVDPNGNTAKSGGSTSESAEGDAADDGDTQTSESAKKPLQSAPMMSNDIMTMALDTNTTYAIVDRNSEYALTSDLGKQQVQVNSDGTVTAEDGTNIAVWSLVSQGTNRYYIETNNRYLDVVGSGSSSLKLSKSTKTWTLTEQLDGSYTVSCTKNGTYYLRCDSNGNFSVTTQSWYATRLYFVEEENITSSGGDTGSSQTVEGLTPSGTVINLFDYSVAQDVALEMNQPVEPNDGINQGHALKFTTGAGNSIAAGTVNKWTGSNGGVLQGIVANTLQNGYPVLSGDNRIFRQIHEGASTSGLNFNESLQYLFDPDVTVNHNGINYKASYPNVGGLLQIDDEGYYYYDCTQNYAEFDKTNKQFTLYNDWAVQYTPSGGATENGQFFPFASYDSVTKYTKPGNDTYLNYYFGMTLTTRFVQDYGGHTDSTKQRATTFEFSGDDDVWIFIDDVLVADLGGIHLAADVDINFADGTVYIDKVYNSSTNQVTSKTISLEDAFEAAGKEVSEATGWVYSDGHWIFADDTYHTLKFFYLERGGYASNMKVKYNLKAIPTSSIVKVDQYGGAVSGAEFALYAAQKQNGTYQYKVNGKDQYVSLQEGQYTIDSKGVITAGGNTITPIYYGRTDSNGNMTFVDDDGMPLALSDLQEMGGTTNFILRETKIPDGYRVVNDEVWMYLEGGILYADNTYDSGAWAAANALVTATDTIYLNDQNAITNGQIANAITNVAHDAEVDGNQVKLSYYDLSADKTDVTGTLFAVVLKYTGEPTISDMQDLKNWVPVYGNELQGYQLNTVATPGDRTSFVSTVIDTAKKMEDNEDYGDSVFTLASSGSMQVLLTQLPDDMKTYYSVLLKKYPTALASIANELGYTVAYYWTTAGSLDGATAENTFRVNAEASTGYDGFERTFGASIEVPNLVNRLFVQKIGEDASGAKVAIDGARFALYEVTQESDGQVYYLADDETKILLGTASQNQGSATVNGATGSYTIDETTGVITVTAGGSYTITPKDVQATSPTTVAKEDGTAVFTNTDNFRLTQGTYCVREIWAPDGYQINNTEIQVLVDDTTIYANAGTETDGVSVGRGPGYVVKPLLKSAAYDDIDNTLTWVYAQMKVTGASTSFSDAYNAAASGQYVTGYTGQGFDASTSIGNGGSPLTTYLEYDPTDTNTLFNYTVNDGQTGGTGTRRLFTSVGWSYYQIFQDYAYGNNHKKSPGARYSDLNGKDISNLFSQSTYIQVENARVSKLEISKTVAADPTTAVQPDRSTQFTFTVTLYPGTATSTNDTTLSGEYPYTVYSGQTKVTSGRIQSGGTIQLTDNQYVVIEELPHNAKYLVSETSVTGYTPSFTIDAGTPGNGSSTGMKQLKWTADNQTTEVAFTNTYKEVKPVNLTLIKVDSANTATKLQNAEFVLYKVENSENLYYSAPTAPSVTPDWTALTGTQTESDYHLTTNASGEIAFVGLTEGTYYLKELKAPDGYTLLTNAITISVTAEGNVTAEGSYTIGGTGSDLTIQVGNSAGITLPETGGTGVIGYTCSGLLLMAAAAMYGVVLRRKREGRGK